jgi:hypothetical protein
VDGTQAAVNSLLARVGSLEAEAPALRGLPSPEEEKDASVP